MGADPSRAVMEGDGRSYFDLVNAACVGLFTRGTVLGVRCSVGPWKPAIPEPHGWAVLNLQGSPLLLAHDPYEAAAAFVAFDNAPAENDPDAPIRMTTDADEAAYRQAERCQWLV